ncbi:MAG: glycoside hydrolase family 99-like domain-containing protein [Xanthobacteraceae bacterium]
MRILVGLIEHIGDIVACEPVARYLKDKHPGSYITWVVSPPYRELIDSNPHIEETLPVDCLTEWMRLSSHCNHDLVIDLHVNYRICQHCRIPLVKRTGNPLVNAFEWFDHGALLEAFSLGAGLPRLSVHPEVYLSTEHADAVDALKLPETFCVIHRVSNHLDKDWPAHQWSALAKIVREDLALPIVEVGAGAQAEPSPLGGDAVDLVNRLTLLQSAEVIRRARMFIGVDSGPAHFANAVRTPGVVLLGRLNNFRQYTPFTGFYASDGPDVKLVRNLTGPARLLPLHEVAEAVRYVAGVSPTRDSRHGSVGPRVAPGTRAPWRDRILASGLFDPDWYLLHNPDVKESGLEPIDHYLLVGSFERREPSPAFNAAAYRQQNADVVAEGMDPLLHYVLHGAREGRHREHLQHRQSMRVSGDGSALVKPLSLELGLARHPAEEKPNATEMPRTFAFYLPQFHPIPENDWAHGGGFSEWHNVIAAKPQFRGHCQPRVPGELGFYDLRSIDVMRAQLALAQEHGIDGFCFYYYYFQGKKLLFKPLENYLHSDLKAPFLVLWANENWSKRWDGGDREIIVAQHHSRDDDLAFIRETAALFRDPRYVKIAGKPILLIYKVHLFPDIKATVALWREEIVRLGFPDLYLVMVDDWGSNLNQPRDLGFDATYEIPSNVVPEQVLVGDRESLEVSKEFEGRIVDYRKFASFHAGRPWPQYKRFRTVMLPWDNTARYASRAMVHINGENEAYQLWLLQALLDTYERYPPEERIVFLHSWNEWCEGTYLEPDRRLGRFFLEQTNEAVTSAREVIETAGADEMGVVRDLMRMQRMKDEGAFRVLQATRAQHAAMQAEIDHLRGRLHGIWGSTSWKLTKPVRLAAEAWKAARGLVPPR